MFGGAYLLPDRYGLGPVAKRQAFRPGGEPPRVPFCQLAMVTDRREWVNMQL